MTNEAHTGAIDLVDLKFGRVAEVRIDPAAALRGDSDLQRSPRRGVREDIGAPFLGGMMLAALPLDMDAIGVALGGFAMTTRTLGDRARSTVGAHGGTARSEWESLTSGHPG